MIKNTLQTKNSLIGKTIRSNEKSLPVHKPQKIEIDPWKDILENGAGCILPSLDENWEKAWIRYYAGRK